MYDAVKRRCASGAHALGGGLTFFSRRVSPSFLMEKNIGPSSASHSGSTAVTHCMYSLEVIT